MQSLPIRTGMLDAVRELAFGVRYGRSEKRGLSLGFWVIKTAGVMIVVWGRFVDARHSQIIRLRNPARSLILITSLADSQSL